MENFVRIFGDELEELLDVFVDLNLAHSNTQSFQKLILNYG